LYPATRDTVANVLHCSARLDTSSQQLVLLESADSGIGTTLQASTTDPRIPATQRAGLDLGNSRRGPQGRGHPRPAPRDGGDAV